MTFNVFKVSCNCSLLNSPTQ